MFSVVIVLIVQNFTHVLNKDEKSSLGGLPARNSGCSRVCNRWSSVQLSSKLRSLIVPLALAAVKYTANSSRSPNLASCDSNLNRLSTAVSRTLQLIREFA